MYQINRICDGSPETAHGAAAVVGGQVYLHGGLHSKKESYPSNVLWWFNPRTNYWTSLNEEGPRLSHHSAFITQDRYINFVGGWDGLSRTASVHTFDTKQETWQHVARINGFPVGGGLSSHSVTPLTSGALVIGRLGGLRTQRRTSAVMKLTGDHVRGFDYEVLELPIESRGGHATVPISHSQCMIVGGRCDPHAQISIEQMHLSSARFQLLSPDQSCSFSSAIRSSDDALSGKRRLTSRRYHVAVGDGSGRVLLHGGEAYEGLLPSSSDVRNDLVVSDVKNNKKSTETNPPEWHPLNLAQSTKSAIVQKSSPNLAAHSCVVLDNTVLLFGGFRDQWKLNKSTYQLKNIGSE